jgi:hypothetical protein
MKIKGNPFSHFNDTKIHVGLAIFWVLMIVPTLLFWKDSVAVVLIYSVYALVAAHIAAFEGAKNDAKIDKILQLLEKAQVKWYTDDMTIYDLAELMHTKLCTWNHIDQCAWHYRSEPDRWETSWEHQTYLKKARSVVEKTGLEPDDIAKVIKAIE